MGISLSLLKRTAVEVETFVQRLDGRVKFLYFIWASILVYIFYDFILNLIFIIVTLLLAIYARVAKPIAMTLLVIIVPWIAIATPILSLPLGFPWNKTIIYYIKFAGYEIPVYLEGLGWGITWPLRIGVCISTAMLFYLTTNQARLVATMFKMKVPFRFIYMLIATFQLIPLLVDEANTIFQAQLSRGLRTDVGIIKKLYYYLALVIPLTLSALNRVQIRAIALESRGFSAPVTKTLMYEAEFKWMDWIFLSTIIVATIVLAYVYITYGYSPIAGLEYIWG